MTGSRSIIQLSTKASLYYYSKDVLFIVKEHFEIENQKKKKRKQKSKKSKYY